MSALWAGCTRGFLRALGARGDLITRLVFFDLILVVMAALWRAALETHPSGIAGYDFSALMWYVVGAQAAVLGVRPRTIEEVGDEIGGGAVAIAMLRPASVVGMRMSIEIGEAMARLLGAWLAGAPVAFLFAGAPHSWALAALAVLSTALAVVANIAAQHAFGGIAFWLMDAKSAWLVFQKLVFLPGGMLIPLELLPGGLAAWCRALPFASMAYAPGRIAAGNGGAEIMAGQLFWVAALIVLALVVFRAGERRLQVVGG